MSKTKPKEEGETKIEPFKFPVNQGESELIRNRTYLCRNVLYIDDKATKGLHEMHSATSIRSVIIHVLTEMKCLIATDDAYFILRTEYVEAGQVKLQKYWLHRKAFHEQYEAYLIDNKDLPVNLKKD